MNVAPSATYEAVTDWGSTGATIGMTVVDNIGGTTVARVTGFTEIESGIYSLAGNVAPPDLGQYSLIYDDDAGVQALGHVATEELIVTSDASAIGGVTGTIYVSVEELARILKINNRTEAQTDAMERVLLMAAGEIDAEINRSVDDDALAGWQLALTAEVNLERAVELWRATPWGIVGIDSDVGATHVSRNTWERYALMLAPLKTQWGLS